MKPGLDFEIESTNQLKEQYKEAKYPMPKWKEQFNKMFDRQMFDRDFDRKEFEDFISSEIIEKLIDEIPDSEYQDKYPGIKNAVLVGIKQQLRTKWL